jgi:hypothetical protein
MRAFTVAFLALLAAAPFALGDDKKDEKKDETFLDVDKLETKDPVIHITRPSKDWVFINLDLVFKKELEKATDKPTLMINQSKQKARLFYGSANASFFVMSWNDAREDLTVEKLGTEMFEATVGAFKDKPKVLGNGRTKLGKLEAWGVEIEGTLQNGTEALSSSKMIVWRPEDKRVISLILELPLKNVALVKKDKAKLFANVKL